jgi:1-acyl-sn-glycerol-3-phosphate acyltransferase
VSVPGINAPFWRLGWLVLVPLVRGAFRERRTGREHIPSSGPTIIASNHISLKDPPFVAVAALPRRVHFMAKSELFRMRAFGWAISALGAFPVVRGGADREAIRTSRALLASGACLIMFPEGTRSRDGRLRPGFPGVGALALEPGVTVVPTAVWGTHRRLGPVRVAFGPPVDLSDLDTGPRGARAQAATDRIMAAIAALLPQVGGPSPE